MAADPFDRNPLADEVRDRKDGIYQAAARNAGPPPGLFPGGDLPPATASGNPPTMLLQLPWKLRHAAAEADQREFARLLSEYSKTVPDADLLAEFDPASNHQGNADYRSRVQAWVEASWRGAPG